MFTVKALGPVRRGYVLLFRSSSTLAVDVESATSVKPYEEIPGPKPLPVIGNLWRFFPGIGTFSGMNMIDLPKHLHETYGSLVRLTGIPGKRDMIYIFDPEDAQKVFRSEGKWPVRGTVQSLGYYRTVLRKELHQGIEGVITSQGKVWQEFRTKVNQQMMQPRSAKLYVPTINDVAEDFIHKVREMRDQKNELPPDFINELYKWSLESVATVALDTRLGCLSADMKPDSEPQKMIDSVQIMLEGIFELDMRPSFWKYVSTPMWRKYVRALDYFTEVSLKYIREAMDRIQANPSNNNRELSMLERLLLTNDNPMIPAVMAMDMLFGGIDTTSHSTAILMFHLSKNQDKQEKLFKEVSKFLPQSPSQPITTELLNEMKYLRACMKESMRVDPIVFGNQRQIQEDIVLSNFHVPKGTDAFTCHQFMCRQEEHFKDADRFIPERWLKESEDLHNSHPFAYLPFGFGVRMCVGRRIAELEILLLVAKLVRNFHIEHFADQLTFVTKPMNMVTTPLNFRMVERE